MKKLLVVMTLGLSLLAVSLPSMAYTSADQLNSAGLTNLTPEQKAMVVQQIATMNAENASPQKQDAQMVESFDKYSDLAIKIGKALAGGAKEIGIAANEFLLTPAGKWTLAIIVYKTMGTDLMHLTGAVLIILMGVPFMVWVGGRLRTTEIKYDLEKKNIFGNHPVKSIVRPELSGDSVTYLTLVGIVILASVIVLLCTIG